MQVVAMHRSRRRARTAHADLCSWTLDDVGIHTLTRARCAPYARSGDGPLARATLQPYLAEKGV